MFASSQNIARVFDKEHKHVIRDIEKIGPDLDPSLGWYRLSDYLDAYGRPQKRYLITRDGFALLVMGYTGEKALRVKVACIQEFNWIEANLKVGYSRLNCNSYSTVYGNIGSSTTGYGINYWREFCISVLILQ
ncbi:Rha family transcriptional regulator [Labrys neptuniae]|uniref:Rha family transcriptional regulator n=1 Tax=Labrys neptuniae TaxID=376174 RepID=UPI0035D6501D